MDGNMREDAPVTCPSDPQVVNGQKLRVTFVQPEPAVDWEQTLCPPVQSPPVEVERKFVVPENCEERIKSLGGVRVRQEAFRDTYFDTEDYQLTLSDMWLRTREGVWQLKYPPSTRDKRSSTRQYCETESPEVIWHTLAGPLGLAVDSTTSFGDLVISRLHAIADIKTTRTTYRVDGVQVTLDVADSDFRVGEIEAMASDKQQIGDAIDKVESLASKLGLKPLYRYDTTCLLPVPAHDLD